MKDRQAESSSASIDRELKIKIALNHLEEECTIRLKELLLAAHMLSFNQEPVLKRVISHYFAVKITDLLPIDLKDTDINATLIKIFENYINKNPMIKEDFMAFFNLAVNVRGGDELLLDSKYQEAQVIFKQLHAEDLISAVQLKLAQKKLSFNKNILAAKIVKISKDKCDNMYKAKDFHWRIKMSLTHASFMTLALAYFTEDLNEFDSQALLRLSLNFMIFQVITLGFLSSHKLDVDYEQAIKNIYLSLNYIDILKQESRQARQHSRLLPASPGNRSTDLESNFSVHFDLHPSLTPHKPTQTKEPLSKPVDEKAKKIKRWQLSTPSSIEDERPIPKRKPVIPEPREFHPRFSGLTTQHMTLIDPGNLGKSRHYWGLWNQPLIEAKCKTKEDLKSCANLFEIFKEGEVAALKNSQGIKYMANLKFFSVKSKKNKARVYANASQKLIKEADTALEFNEFRKNG